MFAGIGGLGLVLGADYSAGSLDAVGPGFLPRLLSWGLIALGTLIAVRPPRSGHYVHADARSYVVSGFSRTRAIVCITAGIIAFSLLIDASGLLIAGAALLAIGAAASHESRGREVIVLGAVLLLFSWALFIWALGLPIPTWPR